MKKIFIYIAITLSIFLVTTNVSARTLADLRSELQQMKDKKNKSNQEKQLTEQQISSTNQEIDRISKKITETENSMKTLNKEIEELNVKAEEKAKEIEKILKFIQVSNGESAYLEYIFGAKDLTDFIYRASVSEQLVTYNNNLINEYHQTIEENETKKKELTKVKEECESTQKELEVKLKSLGSKLNSMLDISVSIDKEIESQEKMINYYSKTLNCTETQDINTCGKIPYSGRMIRPVINGNITSNYGYRCITLNGKWTCTFHNGIDISGGDTKVYATAPGVVAEIWYRTSCGGNMVFIHHNVNGQYYTTLYAHLKNYNVNIGDFVDQNTQIGTMGGNPNTEWWDGCSTGTHLHMTIATGLYLKDYSYWSEFTARNIDPNTLVNFPGTWTWFSNRTTSY